MSRSGGLRVHQMIVHDDARFRVFATKTGRRRSSTHPVVAAVRLLVVLLFTVVVRYSPDRGRSAVHYRLAVVVIHCSETATVTRDVDVSARYRKLLVGHRRARRRFIVVAVGVVGVL